MPEERIRKVFALIGCALWQFSAFLPIFGGGAMHAVRCRGRTFQGRFDDCFNDYLPLLELIAPITAAAMLWPFAKFAFGAWAPEPGDRTMRWRVAPEEGAAVHHPFYLTVSLAGAMWSFWRAYLYPIDRVTSPFIAFWLVFALWFVASAWITRKPTKTIADG